MAPLRLSSLPVLLLPLLLHPSITAYSSASPTTTEPQPDCALVDCLSGLQCVIQNNTAVCVAPGPKCGPTTQCAAGEVCCNESCGYCRKPGQPCTEEYCLPPPPPPPPPSGPRCGPVVCAAGETCCNESCGYCSGGPGGKKGCTKEFCAGPRCGPNLCKLGETCCNESCGYCRRPGEGCTKERCVGGEKCGEKRCRVGEKCCDPFCGLCVKEGGGCGAGCPR